MIKFVKWTEVTKARRKNVKKKMYLYIKHHTWKEYETADFGSMDWFCNKKFEQSALYSVHGIYNPAWPDWLEPSMSNKSNNDFTSRSILFDMEKNCRSKKVILSFTSHSLRAGCENL